ncbi:MAG: DUF3299 domain-containing protein [Verrucomicrobiota bacterium]
MSGTARRLVSVLVWVLAQHALAAASLELTWSDLLPKAAAEFDDPFAELSEEQLLDLGMVARIRYLIEAKRVEPDGLDAEEEQRLVEKLEAEGIDVDWIISQRERVARERRKAAERVDEGVAGKEIRIPGYMLPLERKGRKVVRFLLVPWVGACIHTPPPPPNQMIHVEVPEGTEDRGRFAAIWLEGTIRLEPADYDLFLVDGTRSVKVAYTMTTDRILKYSARESDVLAQVEVPEFEADHGWWKNLQAKVSLTFTKSMTSIRDRESSGPLWTGLLVAFVYGLVHTLGPGHGKAVVISYFVGEGGGLMRGVGMGTKIAVFHVLSAVVVVWLTDFAVRQTTGAAPSDYRMVKLISYAAIAGIGGWMLWKAVRAMKQSHSHDHDHDGCDACAAAAKEAKGVSGWLALAVGSVPCTGALLVLLFGMANDLLVPAILLVVAISAGMAVAMSGIGVLALLGRKAADRKLEGEKGERFAQRARLVGAIAVLLIGCGLFALTWGMG